MKDSVRRCKETFMRVRAFGQEHFAAAEPTSFVGLCLAELDSVITGLDSHAGTQSASRSASRQGTLGRRAARAELMRDLAAIGRTARPMADDDPNLLQQFRVPHSGSDQAVLAAAVAFAAGARQIKDRFILRGLPEDFIEELEADADALSEAVRRNIENRRANVIATAAIDKLVKRGLKALRDLDPYMRNTHADDSVQLAAWRSASRIERRAVRAGKNEQPTAPLTSPTANTPAPAPAG
jgi:hypothetical protein